MEEGKIFNIKINSDTATAKKLYKSFLTKDFLTRIDIREMAQVLASVIQPQIDRLRTPEEQATIVFDVLRPEHILEENRRFLHHLGYDLFFVFDDAGIFSGTRMTYTNDKQEVISEVLSGDELEQFFLRIREGVWTELSLLLPQDIVHLVERHLKESGRVQKLFGDRVLKLIHEDEEDIDRKQRLRALKDLYALPERSPYLSYQHAKIDPTNHAIEIQYTLNFRTLDDIVDMPQEQFSLSQVVGYFLDAVRGASFLVDRGFTLTDLALCNIGVEETSGKGMLFDYDLLRHSNDSFSEFYAAHPGYDPPERRPGTPLTEANMVYEFGIGLGFILAKRIIRPLRASLRLQAMVSKMTASSSGRRPKLRKVVQRLEAILPLLRQ